VVLMAQFIRGLSWQSSIKDSLASIDSESETIEGLIDDLYREQEIRERVYEEEDKQLSLW